MPTANNRIIRKSSSIVRRAYRACQRQVHGGNRPELLIVGAQKAGTSSLYDYLDRVPGFVGAQNKEMQFFHRSDKYAKGAKWYEKHFVGDGKNEPCFFEATPEYSYIEEAAERIVDYRSDMKIVLICREPVSRAYSAWNMYYQWATAGGPPSMMRRYDDNGDYTPVYECFYVREPPGFDEYVDYELRLMEKANTPQEPGILRRGLYYEQVQTYSRLFGADNVLVIGSGELKKAPIETTWKVACHARPETPRPDLSNVGQRNVRQYDAPMAELTRERLSTFYREPNKKLWALLGRELDW